MSKEIIVIDNLKCGGCVNTVTKKLQEMEGVANVNVVLKTSVVEIELEKNISREALIEKLSKWGYPEMASHCKRLGMAISSILKG